jgi:biotin transport system substrate-specific component
MWDRRAVTFPTGPLFVAAFGDSDRAIWAALRVTAVVFLAALTAAAAQVSIPLPFTPVPLTLQPVVVLIGGAVLGPRLGMSSQVLYLAAGALGLPVFAASTVLPQGAARLLGPTGGYLLSYPVAAFVTGWLASRGFDRRYFTSVLAMVAGLAIILATGVVWLMLFTPAAGGRMSTALQLGLYPFVVADLAKVCVAAAILPALWRFTGLGRSSR